MAGDHPRDANAQRLRDELAFMYELCEVVASKTELQPILDWIAQRTTSMFSADEGSIRLLGPDAAVTTLRTLIRREQPGHQSGSWPQAISTSVMGFLMARGEPLASPDLRNDPRFPGLRHVETHIRSVLAVALKVGNRFTGMLAVTRTSPGWQWTADEIQLLSIVAGNSANVIEQARLKIEAEKERIEAERERERQRQLERELETARGIQMSFLPSRPLRAGCWEVVGQVIPARHVGGDAFDCFNIRDDRFAVAIADVSGKGVPAALLMANVQASVRALCDGHAVIPATLRSLNVSVTRSASGKFVTMFYGEVDPRAGVVRYTNAGHNYPLIRRRDGSLAELVEGGIPLGLMEEATYEQGECAFGPGDAMLLFSDGIPEALDPDGQEFGEDRLRAAWLRHGGEPPAQVIRHIFEEVEAFRGGAVQSDDMTLVVVGPVAELGRS